MADQQEAKPTNNGEGWGLPEHPNDSPVHEIPLWLKLAIVFIILNVATCILTYNIGHDSGMEDGTDRYAVQVGTAAKRMPYECRKSFFENLRHEMDYTTKGDR